MNVHVFRETEMGIGYVVEMDVESFFDMTRFQNPYCMVYNSKLVEVCGRRFESFNRLFSPSWLSTNPLTSHSNE